MQLSHETLAECVHCLRRDHKDRLGQERRTLPRFRVWAPLRIDPGPNGEIAPFTGWVRDLSRGGIGVMHTRALPIGTQFVVTLPLLGPEPLRLLCEVVYCGGGAPDIFSIGARFVSPFPPQA